MGTYFYILYIWGDRGRLQVHVHVCTLVCGGNRTTSGVIPQVLSTLFFDTWFPFGLELMEATWAHQQEALGVLLCNISTALRLPAVSNLCSFFMWALGSNSV